MLTVVGQKKKLLKLPDRLFLLMIYLYVRVYSFFRIEYCFLYLRIEPGSVDDDDNSMLEFFFIVFGYMLRALTFRVTGGNTNHYTIEDSYHEVLIVLLVGSALTQACC